MKKSLFAFLAIMILLGACAGPEKATPFVLEPRPTPTVAYQIVGSTKNTFMVVVDPISSTDRKGLLSLAEYLCSDMGNCWVWFWDDINKADTSFPVDPDKEQTLIAFYTFSYLTAAGEIKVYTLGDVR